MVLGKGRPDQIYILKTVLERFQRARRGGSERSTGVIQAGDHGDQD